VASGQGGKQSDVLLWDVESRRLLTRCVMPSWLRIQYWLISSGMLFVMFNSKNNVTAGMKH
jgi:hypothetical protein